MRRCLYSVVLLIFVTAAYGLMAGFYVNSSRYVGRLTVGGRVIKGEPWKIHITTVRNGAGQYLAYDMAGKDTNLTFVNNAIDGADWTIHVLQRVQPERVKSFGRSQGPLYEGKEGLHFQLSPMYGPYKGWFVAEGPEGDDKVRPLVLVKDAKVAATLFFEERFHQPYDKKSGKP